MKHQKKKVQKSILKGAPFLHIIIPFILGILVYNYTTIKLPLTLLVEIIIFLFGINISLLIFRKRFIPFPIISKLFLFFLILFIAILVCWKNDIRNNPYFIGHKPIDSISIWKGIIIENPIEKKNSFLLQIKVQSVKINNQIEQATGEIVAYVNKENFDTSLKIGQVIYSNSKLNFIKNLGNPGEFNYQQYINRKNIFYQTYITNNFEKGEYEVPSLWIHSLHYIQEFVLHTLDKFLTNKQVNGIAKALVIGYRQDLDPDVYQEYVNMGVVHVIAISGLHVGIISYIIGLLLFVLYKQRKGKYIALTIHILLLCGFCFLAGATPSIIRAGSCFIILELGKHLFRPIRNPFQSLALSAFLILCYNPMNIFQLGFIFSYGALTGLFLVAKHIQNCMNTQYFFLNKIVEIVSATLAAQIFVVPISLFLFHQFSIYFIISNLLIVPLTTIVLMGIIILLLIAWIPFVSTLLACMITCVISIMNFIVHQVSSLPCALFTDIPMTLSQAILLYVIAVLLVYWIQQRKRKFILYMIGIFIIYFTIEIIENTQHQKQQFFIVLNTPKQTNLALIEGRNMQIYTSTQDTSQLYKQYIHNLSYFYYVKNMSYHFLDSSNLTLTLGNENFYMINNSFIDTFSINKNNHFIFSNRYHKLYDLKPDTFATYIVLQSKMEKILAPYKTNIFNTYEQGAWIRKIN